MVKRDSNYVRRRLYHNVNSNSLSPLPIREIPRDTTYSTSGEEGLYELGSLMFLSLLMNVNNLSPSLVSVLLGGKK